MPTAISVHDQILIFFEEDEPYKPGHKMSFSDASVLNQMHLRRWQGALSAWCLKHPSASFEEIILKSDEIWEIVDILSPDDGSDPIRKEAEQLARELIERELIAENFPIPSNLLPHIEAVLDANPAILAQAKIRIEARNKITEQMVNAIRT